LVAGACNHLIWSYEDALGRLGITVMSDDEAVEYVREKIRQRDRLMIERCQWEGRPMPA
jgi:hypothetical protein